MYYLRMAGVFVIIYVAICLIYYFIQELLIFHPKKLPQDFEFSYGNKAEEIFLENGSATIHGLYFPVENSKGLILYFHGNSGALDGWGYLGNKFNSIEYSVFVSDYRGYGKSTGRLSEKNLYSDAQVIYDYFTGRCEDERIIIMGRSLGSAIAIELALQNSYEKLILESPFHSLTGMIKMFFNYLPHDLLLQYKFDSQSKIDKIPEPILIFHGTNDEVVPIESARKLESRIQSKYHKFVEIEGGGHNNLSNFDVYNEELIKFLDK